METLLKLLLLAVLPFLAWGYGHAWLDLLRRTAWHSAPALRFLAGTGVGMLLVGLLHRRLRFFITLEHELTHVAAGLAFLKTPRALKVTAGGGGRAELSGLNFVILLSPYFVPSLCLIMLPLPLLLRAEALEAFQAAFGAAVGYHLATTLEETSPRQTDLQESGQWFAWPFLLVANLVVFGCLVAYGTEGVGSLKGFLARGGHLAWELCHRALAFLRSAH